MDDRWHSNQNDPVDLALHDLVALLELQSSAHPMLSQIRKDFFSHAGGRTEELQTHESKPQMSDQSADEPPPEAKELPHVVGNYRLIRLTGYDSASLHYDAVQLDLDRRVRIRSLLLPDAKTIRRAKSCVVIDHPNIEFGIDFHQVDSSWFYVSQKEPGVPIGELIRTAPEEISELRIVRWMRNIVSAVIEIHRHDLVHLNLNPDSIVVGDSGEAIIENPFLGGSFEGNDSSVETLVQSLPFPQRTGAKLVAGSGSLSRIDEFSLGLVFFQLLTKLQLDGFYGCEELPHEMPRLQKLIDDHLNLVDCDQRLKSLCRKATSVDMLDPSAWNLLAFETELESIFESGLD